jgi:CYTH domain-containing protein
MPLEIERKFLVASQPDVWPVPYVDSDIVQVYLVPKDPRVTSERVRLRTPATGNGPPVYTHTKKVRVDAGIHEEDEQVITKDEFIFLGNRSDPEMYPISKRRRVFEWAGHTFELDMFSAPHVGLEVMEVELPSMDTPVELPPFIGIVREVTTEREYTNAALARKDRQS